MTTHTHTSLYRSPSPHNVSTPSIPHPTICCCQNISRLPLFRSSPSSTTISLITCTPHTPTRARDVYTLPPHLSSLITCTPHTHTRAGDALQCAVQILPVVVIVTSREIDEGFILRWNQIRGKLGTNVTNWVVGR